jgi:hypothetical protein
MSNDDRFAIVRVPERGVARDSILAGAVMVGNLNAVMEQLPSTQARTDALLSMYRIADDAVEAEARRDSARADARRARAEAQEQQMRRVVDALDSLTRRIDAIEDQQARQVAVDKAQRIRDALRDLPGHQDDDEPTHHPGGELHELGPSENPAHGALTQPGHHFDPDAVRASGGDGPRVPRR